MVRVNCDQCSQTFNTKKLFVSHLITKSCHKSIREAAKSQTRNKTTPEENFNYPTLEIVPFQDCAVCRRFSKAGLQMYMLAHLASHVQNKAEHFECEDCGLKFESLFYLEKHENKKHKNEKCYQCPKKFKTVLLLKKHVVDVHRKEKCNECDYSAASREILDRHINSKHPKDVCEECGMAFKDQSVVEKHFKEVHEKFNCDECEDEYELEELLDNHKVEVHNLSKTTFKQFGGGLMMMMISESSEPIAEEMEVEENIDADSSKVNPLEKQTAKIESSDKMLDVDPSEDNMLKDEEVNKGSLEDDIGENSPNPNEEVNKGSLEDDIGENSPNPNINVFGTGFFMMYAEDSEKLADEGDSNLDSKDEDPAVEDKEKIEGYKKDAEDPAVEDKEQLTGIFKDAEDPDVQDTKKIDEKMVSILYAVDSVLEETEKLEANQDMKDHVMDEDSSNDKNKNQEQVQTEKSILEEFVIGRQQALEDHDRGYSSNEFGE